MKYELYIDAFVLMNFMMNLMTLWITKELLHRRTKMRHMVCGSFCAALLGGLLFLVMKKYILYELLVHFLLNPCMIYACFQEKTKKEFLEDWASAYMIVLILGGGMEWVYTSLLGRKHFLLSLAGVTTVCVACLIVCEHRQKITIKLYDVKIMDKGRELCLRGYYDSGNILMDPFFQEPVSIIAEKSFHRICDENTSVRLIPFISLGKENGMIETVTIDEMDIYEKRKTIIIKPAILAIERQGMFQKRGYELLINEKLLR